MSGQFSGEFSGEFSQAVTPDPVAGRGADRWRLVIGERDFSAFTTFDFRIDVGRDDPDSQPGTGRATFTVEMQSTDRATQIAPGVPVVLDVTIGGSGHGPTWLRVWTGKVAQTSRAFSWRGGQPSNTVRVDATGPRAQLDRSMIPDGAPGNYPEQPDGLRVWTVLHSLGIPMETVRPSSGHLVDDELPLNASRWDYTTRTVIGDTTAVFTRTTDSPILGTALTLEVVVDATVTRSGILQVEVEGAAAQLAYQYAGTFRATANLTLPEEVTSPTVVVTFTPTDSAWWAATWDSLDTTTWSLASDRTWRGALLGGTDPTTVTLHRVDVWRSGWDMGAVMICAREPGETTAGAHIDEVATAARGVLWETRNGSLEYASALTREPDTLDAVTLPPSVIVADTTSTQALDQIANSATVAYGYVPPPSDDPAASTERPTVKTSDPSSVARYGEYSVNLTGPLRDLPSAQAIAAHVVAADALPWERLSDLRTVPFAQLDADTVEALVTIPLGGVLRITATPGGWVPSAVGGTWRGFIEGVAYSGTVNGGAGSVFCELAVSEWRDSTAAVPVTPGVMLGRPPVTTTSGVAP